MDTMSLGGLTSRMVGDPSEGGLVVVLLHGFGAPGTDLVPLSQFIDCPPRTAFVFPEAPLEMPGFMGGRAWWMLDIAQIESALAEGRPRDMSHELPDGIVEPRARIAALIDQLGADYGVGSERIVLGGFSQGSMVATDVALRAERPVAGLIVWSGTLLGRDQWVPLMSKLKGRPVVQSHGEGDPLLPFEMASELRELFVAGGMDVDWIPFAGGHEIPPEVLDHTAAMIRKLDRQLG